MNWDKRIKSIIKRLSEKHGIDEKVGQRIVDHSFIELKNCIGLPEMPKVLLRGFGTFMVSTKRLKRALKDLETGFEKEIIDKEYYELKKKEYNETIKRRNGEQILY